MKSWVAAVIASSAFAMPVLAQQAVDPASATIESFHAGLTSIMRAGASSGQTGRARSIAPAVDRAFDLATMTRLSVGPSWTTMSAAEQAGLIAAFRAHTIAQYAKNFSSFGGERFESAGPVQTRGADKLVMTRLIVPKGASESLNYRMRLTGGQWKIFDVYYRNAISQLATRRADFASVLKKGGAPALTAHLNALAAKAK